MKPDETLELFFLFITGLGGATMLGAARHPQINYNQIKVASILIGIGLAPFFLMEYQKSKREEEEISEESWK